MQSYIITLIGVVLVTGFAEMLSPDGEGSGLKKYVALLGALCVLSVAIHPFLSVISALYDSDGNLFEGVLDGSDVGEDYGQIYEENLIDEGEANMSLGLERMLCRDLGLREGSFKVSVTLLEGESEYVADRVTVILYPDAIFADPHDIIEYVNQLLGCECEIIYD